ncbi:hypothetical protein ATM17_13250 [Sphingopyxis macrogoltabida]|uniref:Uncharacterized protein n=1 Tax=Sphingopyxis macrogoltabida TaxID=33050 RepID=A0AAC9AVE7_SPHMC|nr:hypothetical protein ATM17_13250 [Sphingopyxis macrogoltabida]
MFGENPNNDGRGLRIWLAEALYLFAAVVELQHLPIAVSDAGGRQPLRGSPLLGASDVVGQFDPHMLVDDALYSADQIIDLPVSEREQPRAGMRDAFADMVAVADSACDATGRVRDDLIDVAGIQAREQRCHTGALIL